MQPVVSAVVLGEEKEAEEHLRDDERLRERDRVRHAPPGASAAGHQRESARYDASRDHEDGVDVVDG